MSVSRLLSAVSLAVVISVTAAHADPADPKPSATPAPLGSAAAAAQVTFAPPPPAVARRVGSLIERLRQSRGNPQERDDTLNELIDIGPNALQPLVGELERRSPATWPGVVYALGAIGDPRVIPLLRRAAVHETGRVYLDVLYALTLAGDPDTLLQALRSTNANQAFEGEVTAVDYIAGAIGPPAVPVLVREIPRRSPESRAAGMSALGSLCDASVVPFLLGWSEQPQPSDRRAALMALARIGDLRAAPRMIEALADKDPSVREAAAEGAGYLRQPAAVPALIKLAREQKGTLHERAVWSLGLIGTPDSVTELVATLRPESNEGEQSLVLKALGNTHEVSAVEPLGTAAMSENSFLATTAVKALTEIPDETAKDRLLAVCSDAPAHEAGLEAARELVIRRDPRAMPCVLKQLKIEIDRRHGLDPVAEDILTLLPLAAPVSMARSLSLTAEGISAPALQHRLRDTSQLIQMVAEKGTGVEPWLQILETGTATEIDLAIMRLADLGDPRAVEPLKNLFGRIEPDRAWRIPEALGRIGSERVTSFLVQLLTDDVYRVPSLARARDEAARALARYAKTPHAAEALKKAYLADPSRSFVPLIAYARVRGPEAIPDLLQLKPLLLHRRGTQQILRHEKINWAIWTLRGGREIPLEEVRDVL